MWPAPTRLLSASSTSDHPFAVPHLYSSSHPAPPPTAEKMFSRPQLAVSGPVFTTLDRPPSITSPTSNLEHIPSSPFHHSLPNPSASSRTRTQKDSGVTGYTKATGHSGFA